MEKIKNTLTTMFTNNQAAFGFVLGISAIIASLIIGNAIGNIRTNDTITVTGGAERIVKSDAGKWTFYVTRQATQQNYTTVAKQIYNDTHVVQKYMIGKGIGEKGIVLSPLTSTEICQYQNQSTYGSDGRQHCSGSYTYSLAQVITVETADVDLLKKLSLDSALDLSFDGMQIVTQSVEFFYTKLADMRSELIGLAGKDARARGGALAKSGGNSLGSITDASQGVFQVTQVNSTEVSDYGTYDTSSIEKKITAVVRASFRVK